MDAIHSAVNRSSVTRQRVDASATSSTRENDAIDVCPAVETLRLDVHPVTVTHWAPYRRLTPLAMPLLDSASVNPVSVEPLNAIGALMVTITWESMVANVSRLYPL